MFALASLAVLAGAAIAAPTPAPLAARDASDVRMTFYNTGVGLGACGELHQDSEYTVAVSSIQFGTSYPSDLCNKEIWITYGGKTTTAAIKDSCPGCPSNGLDLSPSLFSFFADQSVGVISGSWGFSDGSSSGSASTSQAAAPATTSTKEAEPTTTSTQEAAAAPTTSEVAARLAAQATTPASEASAAAAPTTETKEQAAAATTTAAAEYSPNAAPAEATAAPNASLICPNNTLVVYNTDDVLYNGTFASSPVNETQLWNVSQVVGGNATSFCFNSTFGNVSDVTSSFNISSLFTAPL